MNERSTQETTLTKEILTIFATAKQMKEKQTASLCQKSYVPRAASSSADNSNVKAWIEVTSRDRKKRTTI